MTDHSALIERLEANEPLPICPYDRRSPEYWTTNDTDPCKFCGTKNEEGAPDLCRGADTRLFAEAAAALRDLTKWRDIATAPCDGVAIYVSAPGWDGGCVADWVSKWAMNIDLSNWSNPPTIWLPLPSAPNLKETGE